MGVGKIEQLTEENDPEYLRAKVVVQMQIKERVQAELDAANERIAALESCLARYIEFVQHSSGHIKYRTVRPVMNSRGAMAASRQLYIAPIANMS